MSKLKDNHTFNRPAHLRYIELHKVYSSIKNKIKNLNDLEGLISQERYEALLSEHDEIIKHTEPSMLSLKSEIEDLINEKTKDLDSISMKLKENNDKIGESDRLLNHGIIDKELYDKDTKPLFSDNSTLEEAYNKKSGELSALKNALIDSHDDTNHVTKHLPAVISATADSEKIKLKSAVATPFHFFQSFSSSLVLTQIIGFALFGLLWLAAFSKQPNAVRGVYSIGVVAVFVFILFYLFKGKPFRFFTYFITSLFYVVFSLFISSRLWDPQFASSDIWSLQFLSAAFSSTNFWNPASFSKIEFLNFWSGWNMIVGAIILVISIIRSFLIGLQSEYGKRH